MSSDRLLLLCVRRALVPDPGQPDQAGRHPADGQGAPLLLPGPGQGRRARILQVRRQLLQQGVPGQDAAGGAGGGPGLPGAPAAGRERSAGIPGIPGAGTIIALKKTFSFFTPVAFVHSLH